MDFFNLFEVAIGVYLLYSALTGKGKYYENEYCKVSREEYVRVMRILAWVVGGLILVGPVLELTGVTEAGSVVSWMCWGVTMLGIIAMLVANVKMTDRQKAKAAQRGKTVPTATNPDPLHDAFVFDDEEEKPGK